MKPSHPLVQHAHRLLTTEISVLKNQMDHLEKGSDEWEDTAKEWGRQKGRLKQLTYATPRAVKRIIRELEQNNPQPVFKAPTQP